MSTFLGKGINFAVGQGDGPPETFDQIFGLTVITPSGSKWATEDTTSHDSSTPVKTLASTIRDDGTFALTFIYDASDPVHQQIDALSESGALNHFKITYPQGTIGSFTFSGYVTDFKLETTVSGLVKAMATISVTAAISNVPASVSSVAFSDAYAGVYATGNVLQLTATFDEVVVVTGTPEIEVTINSNDREATYASGSGTNILKFHYTIVSGDSATAGQVSVGTLTLNSGTIDDMAGDVAVLTFSAPDTSAYTVN